MAGVDYRCMATPLRGQSASILKRAHTDSQAYQSAQSKNGSPLMGHAGCNWSLRTQLPFSTSTVKPGVGPRSQKLRPFFSSVEVLGG